MNDTFSKMFFQLIWEIKLLTAVLMFCPLFEKKDNYGRRFTLMLAGYAVLIIGMNSLSNTSSFFYITYFILSIYLFLLLYLTRKGALRTYLFHFFSAMFLSIAVDDLRAVALETQYMRSPAIRIVSDTLGDCLLTLFLTTVIYGIAYIVFLHKRSSYEKVEPRKSVFFFYVLLFLFTPLFNVLAQRISLPDPKGAMTLNAMGAFFVLAMLYLQYAIYISSVHELQLQNEATEREALERISKDSLELYGSLRENMDTINIKCHDIKHRLSKERLENDQWTQELIDSIDIYDRTIKTGNEELDTVLMYHSMRCSAHRIRLSCVADGSKLSFMELSDIYTLFGNAISNAAEYLLSLPEDKRIIKLCVKAVNSFLVIEVENYFEGELSINNGMLMTRKDDAVNHGFGIKSMKQVAEKYDGDLNIRTGNDIFKLTICIPLV